MPVTIVMNRFPQVRVELPAEVGRNLGKAADALGGMVSAHAPVLTGNLRDSVEVEQVEEWSFTVTAGNEDTPAPPVEFGHKQHPGQYVPELGKRLVHDTVAPVPFFMPAIYELLANVGRFFN